MTATTTVVTAYSLNEAAKKLGVTRQTVWKAIKDGKLASTKSGNAVIIYSNDLLDYVLSHRRGEGIPEA